MNDLVHYLPEEEDPTPDPDHDHGSNCCGICRICGKMILFVEETAGNGDVLDSWWSHVVHPKDNHDAELEGS